VKPLPIQNVYPVDQPTIIIGPNSIRTVGGPITRPLNQANQALLGPSFNYPSLGGERQRRRMMDDNSEFDDEDQIEHFRASGMMNDLDFFTWDLIIKNTPRLPFLEPLLHKSHIVNRKFFQHNDYTYNPPFLIFNRKIEEAPADSSMANFTDLLRMPHSCELLKFYEDFNLLKYPKAPLLLCKKKLFFVQYEQEVMHAIDGLGSGVIIVPVNGNFIIKIYEEERGEKFIPNLKAVLELTSLLIKG